MNAQPALGATVNSPVVYTWYELRVLPVCLLPGYPVGSPGRVLATTGSGSDPKPAQFFGPGTGVPV